MHFLTMALEQTTRIGGNIISNQMVFFVQLENKPDKQE